MPIYAYRCDACGFAKDVLQKMSEDPLTVCPECHQASFKKQVTAAGFQLKGSGWYVTDFRGGTNNAKNTGAVASESKSGETGNNVTAKASTESAATSTPVATSSAESSTSSSASTSGSDKAA